MTSNTYQALVNVQGGIEEIQGDVKVGLSLILYGHDHLCPLHPQLLQVTKGEQLLVQIKFVWDIWIVHVALTQPPIFLCMYFLHH